MRDKKNWRDILAETFELPKEIMLDLPRVTLVGNVQLSVQNHRGIVEYTDQVIRVSITGGELLVRGEKLWIKSVFCEEILIQGTIFSLYYRV